MEHYTSIVPIFLCTNKLEFYLYGCDIQPVYRLLFTIYQQHKNFKVFIYVGVLLIQIKFICVLTCLFVEITCWLNFAHKNTHQCNGNGKLGKTNIQ